MTVPDQLIDVCQPFLLMGTDRSVRPKALPGKTDHQGLELFSIQLHPVTLPMAWPGEFSLVQTACCQPHPKAIVHQDFYAIASAIGKQIGAVRLRRTEDSHDTGERFFGAAAHVHRFCGQPDCVDADHCVSPRTNWAQPVGSEEGHFTVMVCSPKVSSMIAEVSAGLFGAIFTGTNAGSVAGDLSR